jgi:hypothetical protein
MTDSIGSVSGINEKRSFFRSLSDSLNLGSSFFRGRAVYLGAFVGSTSGSADQGSFFRALTGSITSVTGFGEKASFFMSLSSSWTVHASRGLQFIENLGANFNRRTVLSGHTDCSENIILNCGSSTASFAFLVIGVGVSIFSIYAFKQRRRFSTSRKAQKDEKVVVDPEGWETKHRD